MRPVVILTVVSAIYATLRYNVFKGVPWIDWPVYVLNKVFALSALLLLVAHLMRRRRSGAASLSPELRTAGVYMLLHVVLSLVLLRPEYYPKYFEAGKLTLSAALSLLAGAVAMAGVRLSGRNCENNGGLGRGIKLGLFAFLSGIHAALLGFKGWFEPKTWPGYMLPITLISFLAGCAAIAAVLWPRRDPAQGTDRSTSA